MNIKYLREEKGLSQQAVGDAVSLTQQAINRYENAHTEPDIETLKSLATFFNVSVDFLIGHSEIRKPTTELEASLLNDQEKAFISVVRKLPDAYRRTLLELLSQTVNM